MVRYFVTNLCGLRGSKSRSLLNATKRQLTRKMEVVGEPPDLPFWGVLGFSVMGIPPTPPIMNSRSSAASHLIHVS